MDSKKRADEARNILRSMASKKGWEKQLKQKVETDIARRTKKKLLDKEKGLPPKALSIGDLV